MLITYLLFLLGFCLLFLATTFVFYRYIYTTYKINTQELAFDELLLVLNASINTQIELYEQDIFKYKGAITNANFENYYNTITKSIINSVSAQYMKRLSFFITEDEIIAIICRKVKEYLTTKVNGTV